MRERNPDDKKRRLLDAALTEFARSGLAGTRIDTIASRAACSAGLVYTYFGSKEALFDAVLADISERTVAEVALDPADLPGYARRLHEAGVEHPDVQRFATWYQLERTGGRSTATDEAMSSKIEAIRRAQEHADTPPAPDAAPATLDPALDPAALALAVQALARMWFTEPEAVTAVVDPEHDEAYRSRAVEAAAAALVAGARIEASGAR
ncbi:TetR family transcriptional regulator [Frondihabitans australicus]|uniref:TetR family transcriptional regulator n=1 Tax=Frondihabitans australicus TaxID=386892 RepID=A0A495IE58_9MICO|nr:TetR family transcriptional regulator [Frondihabitans australicus]RKR73415.1 TetR family transcriptional regulator [Frondihabitans australicus]